MSAERDSIIGAFFKAVLTVVFALFGWLLIPLITNMLFKGAPSGLTVGRDDFERLLALVNAKAELLVNGELFIVSEVSSVQADTYVHFVQVYRDDNKMMLEIEWPKGASEGYVRIHYRNKKLRSIATKDGSWSIGREPMPDDLLAVLR